MEDFDIEARAEQAVRNFESGYNCAQSVFLAYADLFGLERELAQKMSVSFGGGMGRMREVCGTVSAMAMLAGFRYPVADAQLRDGAAGCDVVPGAVWFDYLPRFVAARRGFGHCACSVCPYGRLL